MLYSVRVWFFLWMGGMNCFVWSSFAAECASFRVDSRKITVLGDIEAW